jgi:PAS domain-containing protein
MPRRKLREVAQSAALRPDISLRQHGGGWREAMEAYGEALTMAEAGEGDLAREILGEFYAEHRKILVLAEADGLPEAMVGYSVNLAERLGFDLVLLSVCPPDRPGRDFETRAVDAAGPLFAEAKRRKVSCAHILRRGRRDEVLSAVSLELRRVEFVISRRPESERRQAALMVPEFSLKC